MRIIDGAVQPYALTVDKFLDHAAKWHGEAEVVTARPDGTIARIGYAALRDRALKVSVILEQLGVGPGARVATLAWNSQAHLEAWYAIVGLGAAYHTLNPRLTATQSADILSQSDARILICSADLAPLAADMAAHTIIDHILIIDGEADIGTSLEAAIAEVRTEATWRESEETAAIGHCFTSGTTGTPKGVTYTHRSTFLHTLRVLQADMAAYTAQDSILTIVPMFHANAWGIPFAAPAVGANLVFPGRQADGARLTELINSENVTVAAGVPTVFLGLLEHLEANGGELPSLKRIIVGGASMSRALMTRIENRLGVIAQPSWGMTEMSPTGTMTSYLDPDRDASIAGRPAVGVDLLLTDAEDRALPEQRGVEGRLKVKGGSVIERYMGQEDSATDADGWFDTGDLARIDAKGNLAITGRSKDLIKSGGEWINPAVIEAIIGVLPEVSLAAVIGRVDPKWGERPILVVEMREHETLSDEELLKPLQGRVASWWVPDAVVKISKMPTASTGKVDKMNLRSLYGGPQNG